MAIVMANSQVADRHKGLVMVKPHAMKEVLDPVIESILSGGHASMLLPNGDPLLGMIQDVEVGQPTIRDLRSITYGEQLITLFYSDKSDRRYYPILRKLYLGKVAFLPFIFHGNAEQRTKLVVAMKGTTETYDEYGSVVTPAAGIRGALGVPYLYTPNDTAKDLDDRTYQHQVEPVVNNYIHVCDTPHEIELALELIL